MNKTSLETYVFEEAISDGTQIRHLLIDTRLKVGQEALLETVDFLDVTEEFGHERLVEHVGSTSSLLNVALMRKGERKILVQVHFIQYFQ